MNSSNVLEKTVDADVPEGWHKITLGQLVTFHRGYDLPLKDTTHGKYPIVGSNGVIGYHDSFKIRGPGVTIGRSGNLGKPFFVEKDYWPHNTVLYVSEFHCSDPYFVYYFLRPLNLADFNAGSAVPTLNRNHIHTIEVVVPKEIAEQKVIGKTLSCFDFKIELNHRINKTLEDVGQAIFKRWFVDFEFPNEEGKPYKSSGGQMVYNEELGKDIPVGWVAKEIGELARINAYSINRDFKYSEIEYIDIDSVDQGIIRNRQILQLANAPSRAKRIVKDKDIIISTVRPNLRHYALIQGVKPNTIVSTGFAVISPTQQNSKFLYYFLTTDKYTNFLTAIADTHTSTYPSFNPDIIQKSLVAYPTENEQQTIAEIPSRFESIMDGLFRKIQNNNEQISSLSQLREILLPKLMSGKIRVPVSRENVESSLCPKL
jgi:type I restriction enzyme S subunit